MVNTYDKAYTEVLEILKMLPEEEFSKIPKEEIEFYEKNCDKNYMFKVNKEVSIEKQNISRKANAVLVSLFEKYFASEIQKQKLNNILLQNLKSEEYYKKEKFNPDKIFNNKDKNIIIENKKEEVGLIVNEKKNWFVRLIDRLKKIFRKG